MIELYLKLSLPPRNHPYDSITTSPNQQTHVSISSRIYNIITIYSTKQTQLNKLSQLPSPNSSTFTFYVHKAQTLSKEYHAVEGARIFHIPKHS